MQYYLYPPFFVIEPQTSFDEAWEVFCCKLLNLEHSTNAIRRRIPPDLGADLVWEAEGTIYQCKAVEDGQPSSLNTKKVEASIDTAKKNQRELGWKRYVLCTNVELTGSKEQRLRRYLPGIEFLTQTYWTSLSKKFNWEVSDRFRSLLVQDPQLNTLPASPVIWNVPYLHNDFFTGREKILAQLHDRLHTKKASDQARRVVISGLGGIGKTQIATEYAYRHRDAYCAILWVRATRNTLLSDFAALAEPLDLPGKDEQNQNMTVTTVKQWLGTHDGWLLILDDAEDLSMVREFLPTGGAGHILFTTRAYATGAVATPVEIEKMDLEEGTQLLLRRARIITIDIPFDQVAETERSKAKTIVEIMDGLPLALDQAGAYIEETGCGLSGYLDLYQEHSTELLKRRSAVSPEYTHTVATVWSISFRLPITSR